MIITAGELKGRKIFCPVGNDVRPTSSKIRQAIFNILYSMDFDLRQRSVLELFSGTGIVSIEAISRGAKNATLVDNSTLANGFAEKNRQHLCIKERINIIRQDSVEYVKHADLSGFDLIFIDPPYRYERYDELLAHIFSKVNNGTIVMAESNKVLVDENNKINSQIIKTKNWGKTFMTFMRKSSDLG